MKNWKKNSFDMTYAWIEEQLKKKTKREIN